MGLKKWLFSDESLDEKKIIEVERLFGFKLPDDYKKCIMENNGGFPEPNIFNCDDGRIEAVFNNLISFTDENLNIKMFYEFSSQKLIPFARDPFGNLLCFDYSKNNESPKIVFYNYEETGSASITPVCKSFTALLDRLYSLT
ncbi:SMI1/KNR4 family protein [Bacillus aquiflavi]|uniref:SMI1/KNR4 family protein n=1 Tax=Bacillus aquiflavi TaxID=2672567 RepID=A0A6B3W365_9BACI|nr:SMI1/KNR4 family protein [Bacillus aquiflavi]MBA4538836.1 SMI1/KNR4 family protein [Bacillus aquiflavi]NEY83195.1 SMI1/KNR4 family protein [Bacillus aquiflavi]UAC48706.1 SMI1/KNR4 family protein [Bacillus aquiflavi]